MKLGIISDTHGYMDKRILHHLEMCDQIWHAGDIGKATVTLALDKLAEVIGVFGNIDGETIRLSFKEFEVREIQGLTILMIHIAGAIGKYNQKTQSLIKQYKPDVLICGHSHILKVKRDERFSLMHINPGAAGIQGFHKVRTMLRVDLSNGRLENLEVIELGPRSAQSVH